MRNIHASHLLFRLRIARCHRHGGSDRTVTRVAARDLWLCQPPMHEGENSTMEATFESAIEGLDSMGASVHERELVGMLARHGKEEGVLLERYQRFATDAGSPAVRYLVQMILDEERRHHRLLAEMANTIAWGWSENSPGEAAPEIFPRNEPDDALARETRELLAAEKRDRGELRKLRKELKPFEQTTLWALVVDLMLLDTEKHTRILRFISKNIA